MLPNIVRGLWAISLLSLSLLFFGCSLCLDLHTSPPPSLPRPRSLPFSPSPSSAVMQSRSVLQSRSAALQCLGCSGRSDAFLCSARPPSAGRRSGDCFEGFAWLFTEDLARALAEEFAVPAVPAVQACGAPILAGCDSIWTGGHWGWQHGCSVACTGAQSLPAWTHTPFPPHNSSPSSCYQEGLQGLH